MESLQPSVEAMEDVFLQDDIGPTIAEHATQCQSLFNKYMTVSDTVPDPTIMDDQLARFSLWTSNMDVYGPPNVCLDYRLRFSPTVADIIHQLLELICDTLLSLKPIDQQPPQIPSRKRRRLSVHGDSEDTMMTDDHSSDSETDIDTAEGNILKITETIGGTITRLFRLSNAVRKSAKANRARKIEMFTGDEQANKAIEELRLYTKSYIEFRFPEAPEALRFALIEANALRLRRLYYQHSHRRQIDLIIQSPKPTPAPIIVPKITDTTPTVRFALNPLSKSATISKMPAPSPAPATNATTARQSAVAALYAKSETEVPNAKSVIVNNKLSFPPIPPTKQCPYCGVIIEFKNGPKSSLWHKHVIGDLEPFICIFSQCLEACHHGPSTPTFETSKAWSNHMQTAHGKTWECRAPSHDPIVFDQEIQYRQHSIKEHGVPEAFVATLSNAAQRPGLNKVLECPFGDDFQPPDNAGSNNIFSTEALESHVAGHMKEIALLALQKLPTDGGEDVNIDSDQLLEDEVTAGPFGIKRTSMCSILDDELLDFSDNEEIGESDTKLNLEGEDNQGLSELHQAVQKEDLGLIAHLAGSGVDMNSKDENGQTPLHYAAERGLVRSMRVLVDNGADRHIADNSGFSSILWAVIAGQKYATQQLLFEDTGVSYADVASTLTWAIRMGRATIATMIAQLVETSSGFHLQEAAASGRTDIVRLLLKTGYDPNYHDRDGWSALHYAAEEGHLDIVQLLLNAGADPIAIGPHGTSPLHCAANGGHVSIMHWFIQMSEVNLLTPTDRGWTPLHYAAYMGHPDAVWVPLEYDLNIASQRDNEGWTALHLAVLRHHPVTVRILLDAVPQLQLYIYEITAEGWLYSFRGAISYSAFEKSQCCQVVTGLRQAVTIGSLPLVKLMIKLGHDVNGVDSGNRTALYHAVSECMFPMIDFLLAHGADPNILPVGRIDWEDFVPDPSILQRLTAAGYNRPEDDDATVELIREELRLRKERRLELELPLSGRWTRPDP